MHGDRIDVGQSPAGRRQVEGQPLLLAREADDGVEAADGVERVGAHEGAAGDEPQQGRPGQVRRRTQRAGGHRVADRIEPLLRPDQDPRVQDGEAWVRLHDRHGPGEITRRPPRVVVGERDEWSRRFRHPPRARVGAHVPSQGDDGDVGVGESHGRGRAVAGAVVDQHHRRLVARERGEQFGPPVTAGDDDSDVVGIGHGRTVPAPPASQSAVRRNDLGIDDRCGLRHARDRQRGRIGEQPGGRGRAGDRVRGQHHRGRRPRGALDRPAGVVGEDVAGPVGAVVVPQVLHRRDLLDRRVPLPGGGQGSASSQVSAPVTQGRSETHRAPRPGTTNRSQSAASRSRGRGTGQRAAEHRVVPVHGEAGAVGEVVGALAQRRPEVGDRDLPVGLRLAADGGQRDAAAQRLEEARVAGQERGVVRRPVGSQGPADRAAGQLHPGDQVQARPDRRPQRLHQLLVSGEQPAVPDADGEVAGVVALGRRCRLGAVAVLGGPRPVRSLPPGEPAVGRSGPVVPAAEVQGHRRLDGVPGVQLAAAEPGQRAVGVLLRRRSSRRSPAPRPRSGPRAAPAGGGRGQRAAAVRSHWAGPPPAEPPAARPRACRRRPPGSCRTAGRAARSAVRVSHRPLRSGPRRASGGRPARSRVAVHADGALEPPVGRVQGVRVVGRARASGPTDASRVRTTSRR